MSVLPGLHVPITLDSATFTAETRKVGASVDRLGRDVKAQSDLMSRSFASAGAAVRGLALGLGALVTGVGIAGIVRLGRDALNTADALNDLSQQTGASVELLQALQRHAQLSGSSADAMNGALLNLTKGVGQLQDGTGRLSSQLAKLDPELRKQLKSATDQEAALRAVAESLKRAGSEAEQQAIAVAVFGDAGRELAVAFREGGASVDGAIEAFKRMGGISTEAAVAAAKANDEIDKLSQTLSTNLARAFLVAAPQVEGLAFLMNELALATKHFFEELNATGVAKLDLQIADLNERIAGLGDEQERLERLNRTFGGKLGLGAVLNKDRMAEATAARDELLKQRDALVEVEGAAAAAGMSWEKGERFVSNFGNAAGEAAEGLKKLTEEEKKAQRLAEAGRVVHETSAAEERFAAAEDEAARLKEIDKQIAASRDALGKAQSANAAKAAEQTQHLFETPCRDVSDPDRVAALLGELLCP